MIKHPALVFALLFAVALPVAAREKSLIKNKKAYDCAGKSARAVKYYKQHRYTEASTMFDDIRLNCSSYDGIDTVLFYSGMSKLKTKMEAQAAYDFRDITASHPSSPFASEAAFRLVQCAVVQSPPYEKDQQKTREAIVTIEDYLATNPPADLADSAQRWLSTCERKLITKDMMTARFYEKVRKWESSVIYYQSILAQWPSDSTAAECRLALGRNLIRVNRYEEAARVLTLLTEENAATDYARKAKNILARLEKNRASPGATSTEILDEPEKR